MKTKTHTHFVTLAAAFAALLAAPAARAQAFQPGEILLNNFLGSNVQRYSAAGTLIQTYTGTGAFWEGASLTPGGDMVTTFRNPNGGIDIFNPSGTQVGSFAAAVNAFPGDVSVFANGMLALNDQDHNTVQLFSQSGTLLSTVSLPGVIDPVGSTVGTDNILYVAGKNSNNLARVSQTGTFLGTISLGFSPGDLVMSPADGTLWVSGHSNGLVEHITTAGTVLGSFSTGLTGSFNGLGIAPDGNSLYVTTESSSVIRHFGLDGIQLGDFTIASPNQPLFLTVAPGISTSSVSTWNGGAGNWSNDALWTPGGAPNSADADVHIDGGKADVHSVVTMDASFGAGRLTLDLYDTLNLASSTVLTISVSVGAFSGAGSIVNNGIINFGNGVDLQLTGNVTLSSTGIGHGTIRLDSSGTDRIFATSPGDTLTVGGHERIEGAGNIGAGQTTVINDGTIVANESSNALVIQPGGGAADAIGFTNTATGSLVATAGGTLTISGGRFTNNGSIVAGADSQIQLSGVNVLGGTLANAGSAIHSLSSTFTNVTNNGNLILDDGGTNLVGTFTNNASITFASAGLSLLLSGNVTLAGTGTVTLDSSGTDVLWAPTYGDLLTVGAGQTIQGAGNIGNGYTRIINNGTILANQPANPLVLQAAGGVTVDLTNNGALRATGGSTLQINGGRFTNSGSLLADASSRIQLNGVSVLGGTLATAASSVIHSASSTFTNVTNNGHLILDDGGTNLVGTFTNNATVTYASAGLSLLLSGNVTLAGTGTVTLDSSGTDVLWAPTYGDLLTVGAGQTIRSAGNIGNGYTRIINNGTILANQPANPLVLQAAGGVTVDLTNNGALRATGGSTLQINGGRFTNSGTLLADASSRIQLNGVSVLGGTLTADASSVIHSASSTFTNVTNNGHLILDDGGTNLVGTFTNNASITFASAGLSLLLSGNVTLAGTGTVTLDSSGTDVLWAPTYGDLLTVGAGQTIQGAGNIGNGYTRIINNGTILANQPAPLILQAAGGTTVDLTNNGTLRAAGGSTLQINGGRFTNSGSLLADASSRIQLNGVSVLGGTLATAASSVIHSASSTFTNVTNNGHLILDDGGTNLVGTFTNNASITFASAGLSLLLSGNVTLAGTGTVTLDSSGTDVLWAPTYGALLTIGAGQTIQGAGNIGNGYTTIANNGRIVANQPANPLVLQPAGGTTVDFTNNASGWLHSIGGGTVLLNGGVFTNYGLVTAERGAVTLNGTVTNYDAATTTLNGGSWLVASVSGGGATLNGSGFGPITINNAGVSLSGVNSSFAALDGLIENRNFLQITGGRNFTVVPGPFLNRGAMNLGVGSTFTTDRFLNDGQLALGGSAIVAAGGVHVSLSHLIWGFGTITGGVTNAGTIRFELGGPTTVNGSVTNFDITSTITVKDFPATFNGTVVNNGTFEITHTTVTYGGTFTNNATYISGSSTQNFTNLVIAPTGSITAGAGDVFNVSGDVTNNSTQNTTFNVSQAKFIMQGAGSHQFIWPGSTGAGTNSFAIGTLEVKSGETVTITTSGPGSGIVMGALIMGDGAEVIFGDGTPGLAAGGAGKFDAGFSTPDGSQSVGVGSVGNLAPPATVPEPGTMGLLALGAIGGGIVGRRNRIRGGR